MMMRAQACACVARRDHVASQRRLSDAADGWNLREVKAHLTGAARSDF
jgi:hypothetical protein